MSLTRSSTRWPGALRATTRSVRHRQTAIVAMVLLATLVLAGCSGGIPQPGDKAPSFELHDTDGQPVALADLLARNEAVVLVFYRGFF